MFPDEALQNTLGKAAEILRQLGIRFHLTGGVASVLYGEPRMTQDIDIVVDNRGLTDQLDFFLAEFAKSGFLFEATSVRTAVERQGRFQLFDNVEALKLDIYPPRIDCRGVGPIVSRGSVCRS